MKAISGRLSKEAEPSPDEVGRESRPPAVTGTRAVSEASRSAILDGGAGSALADQPGNCKQGNGKEAEVAGKSRKDGRKRGRAAEQGSASVHESASLAGKEKPGIVSPAERAGEEKLGGFAADPGLNDGVAPLARFDGDEGAMVRFSAVEAGAEAKVRNEAKSSDARRASAQGLNGEASARGAEQPVEAGNSISTVGTEMNSIADGKAKEPNVVAPGAVESEAGNVDGAVEAMAFGTVRRAEITDDGMPAARMDEVGEIADVPARGGTDVALGVGAERPIERSDDVRSDGGAGYEMGEEAAMTEAGRDGREAAGGRADVTAECDKKERESAGEKTPLKNLLADIEREIRERERAIWESAPPGERLPLQDWGGVLVDEIADVTEKRDGEGGAGFGPTGGEQMRGSGPSGARPEEEMDVPESMPPKGEREPRQTAARNEVMSGSGTRVVAVTGDVDGEFVVRSGAETGVREAEGISRDERRTTAGLSSPPNNHQNRAASGENGKESVQESEKTDARALQPEFGLPPPESEHTQVPQQLTEGITDGEGAKSSESGDATCQTKRPEIGSLWAACAQQIQSAPDFPLPTTHPATISASESGGRSEPRAGGGSAASARGPLERSGEPPGGILESLAGVVSALKGAIRATQEGGRVIGAGLETLLQALEPLEQGALRLGPGVEGAAAFCVRGLSSRGVAECAFGPTSPGETSGKGASNSEKKRDSILLNIQEQKSLKPMVRAATIRIINKVYYKESMEVLTENMKLENQKTTDNLPGATRGDGSDNPAEGFARAEAAPQEGG